MPDRAQRYRQVAYPCPHVSPFATTDFERSVVKVWGVCDPSPVDDHRPGPEADRFSLPRQIVGSLAVHLDGGIGRWHLRNVSPKPRQHRFDLLSRGSDIGDCRDATFGIVAVPPLAPAG